MKKLDKDKIQDLLALTPLQAGMLSHYLKEPGSDYYFEQLSLEISGAIDKKIFEEAWARVVRVNEALRTFFRWEKLDNPTQVVLKQHIPDLSFVDLSSIKEETETQHRLEKIKQEDRKKKFDLGEVPFRVLLCKVSDRGHHMIISNHHILYDGWSTGIILKEFFQAYAALAKGEPVTPPGIKPPFREFIRWHQNRDRVKQKKFWDAYLQGFAAHTQLPVKRKAVGHHALSSRRCENSCFPGTPLQTLTQERRVTLAAVFYCAWGLLLQKYCGSDDVVMGTTVSGRSAPINGIEHMVGLFINTLPLRVTTRNGESLGDVLAKVNQDLLDREKYENTSLVEIKADSHPGSGAGLFDTLLVIENYPLDHFLKGENKNPPFTIPSYSAVESTPYDLNIAVTLNDNIEIRLIYNGERFAKEVIARLSRHFIRIINEIVANPLTPGHDIDILSGEEKRQLLVDFNETGPGYPRDKTLQGLFTRQAKRTPQRVALVGKKSQITNSPQSSALRGNFLDTLGEVVSITYRQLEEKSGRLARCLLETGVKPGEPLGIMVGRSLEMIIGILGILKAGCAYVPLDPKAPLERIDYMLTDSSARVLVSTGTLAVEGGKRRRWEGKIYYIEELLRSSYPLTLLPSAPPVSSEVKNLLPATGRRQPATSLAYIIYTSGSTGKPKGVPITHSNFSPLIHWGCRHLGIKETDRVIQNLSYYFDWSVWEIFIALTSGASLYMVPGEVVSDAEHYLDLIQRQAITVLHITPTHFQSLISVRVGQRLSRLRYLCLGAEKLSCDLVERSYEWVTGGCRVYNMYGPTEATIMAAVLEIEKSKLPFYRQLSSVPTGKNLGNNLLFILDRHRRPCPLEVPGELVIGGDGVARGYLNNPGLTCDKFKIINYKLKIKNGSGALPANLNAFGQSTTHHSPITLHPSPLYKTGDLARWLPEGTVEFLGRLDQQVKIRGFRIEPGEIEKNLLEHREVKDALVTAGEYENNDKYLCAYVVPHLPGSSHLPNTLKQYLSGRLPDYMVPAYFVTLDRMPLNPNGKVDIKALPGPGVTSAKGYTAPGNDREKALVEIWAGVLGIGAAVLGIDDDFFQLGGHSLNATRVIGRIHKELKIRVPFGEIFVNPTVRELAAYIDQKEESRCGEILPVEEREYYPLAPAQRRLFILQQMEAGCTAYNIHGIFELEGAVDKEKLGEVFVQLIARHESLRTSFELINEEPVQRIHEEVEFQIENYQLQDTKPLSKKKAIKNFVRPFDLARAPLLRVGLLEQTGKGSNVENRHGQAVLMVDLHHAIADGISIDLLVKNFSALYGGEQLPVLGIQYKEFSEWQRSGTEREKITAQEAYWLKEFSGEIPSLNLPADYVRPVAQSFTGSTLEFAIPIEQSKGLKELALNTKTTLFMVLLAIYTILLSKISGQEDILVGTPAAGRRHPGLERITGMFVNTVVLRNFPHHEKSFVEFLSEVKQQTLEAFENQDYSYEALVDALAVNRNTARNPLFDTMFALQNMEISSIQAHALKITPYRYEEDQSKFDISLIGVEKGDALFFTCEYSTTLFKKETIERFILFFREIVSSVLGDTKQKLSEISIIPGHEKKQLVEEFNHPARPYPLKTVTNLLEEQSERSASSTACFYEGNYLTFEELNKRVQVLANLIEEL